MIRFKRIPHDNKVTLHNEGEKKEFVECKLIELIIEDKQLKGVILYESHRTIQYREERGNAL